MATSKAIKNMDSTIVNLIEANIPADNKYDVAIYSRINIKDQTCSLVVMGHAVNLVTLFAQLPFEDPVFLSILRDALFMAESEMEKRN